MQKVEGSSPFIRFNTCKTASSDVLLDNGYLDDEQWQFSVAFRGNQVDDSQVTAAALWDHLAWFDIWPCERDLSESVAVGVVDEGEAKHGRGA